MEMLKENDQIVQLTKSDLEKVIGVGDSEPLDKFPTFHTNKSGDDNGYVTEDFG